MPSLVATTSASTRKMFVRMHSARTKRKNNAKFSGHYVRPRTHAQRSCARTPFAPICLQTGLGTTTEHVLNPN